MKYLEFSLNSLDSALPVEVTVDEDNGRYMIRKSDMSGEFFNSPSELIAWLKVNLQEDEFCDRQEFYGMMEILEKFGYNSESLK